MTTANSITLQQDATVTKDGKREKIGEYPVLVPMLSAFGIEAEIKETDKDGTPVYADDKFAWLFNACLNQSKASARGKLKAGTADVRTGGKFDETLEELFAPSVATGSVVLVERSALFKKWNAFIDSLNKQPAVAALAKQFMKSPDGLMTQPQKIKDAMMGWMGQFVDAHGDDLTEVQGEYLATVEAAITQDAADLDW